MTSWTLTRPVMRAVAGCMLMAAGVGSAGAAEKHLSGRTVYFPVDTTTLPAPMKGGPLIAVGHRNGLQFNESGEFTGWAQTVLSSEITGGAGAFVTLLKITYIDGAELHMRSTGTLDYAKGRVDDGALQVVGGSGIYEAATGSGTFTCQMPQGQPEGHAGGYFCDGEVTVLTSE